jgi:DNA-binding MltR family transcriptional regulator
MKIVAYDPSKDPEFKKFIEEIEKESEEIKKESVERAQAIICHAYVEELLKELLKKRLIKDKDFLKSLEKLISFSRLLTLCYITGIVNKAERKDIKLLAKIRNRFAHKREIKSFNAEDIPELCNDLRIPKPLTIELTPQEKFIKTAAYYIQILNLKLKYTKKVKLVEEESDELKVLDTLYA